MVQSGLIGISLWFAVSVALAGGHKETAWPCGGDPDLLRDHNGKEVWIESSQTESLAVTRPTPAIPSSMRIVNALVTVDILIDKNGNVKCVRGTSGHPLLQREAVKTAWKWTFRPYTKKGKPVAVFGKLEFRFDTGS